MFKQQKLRQLVAHHKIVFSMALLAVVGVLLSGALVARATLFGGSSYQSQSVPLQLQKGLVGHWPLDGTAKDATPFGNDGTVINAVATTDRKGKANGAYSFNGTDARISLPTQAAITGDDLYAISVWIKPNQFGARGIVGWGQWGTANQVNALRMFSQNGVTGLNNYWWANDRVASAPYLTDGKWHHVVAQDNGTIREFYIDGQYVGSNPSGINYGDPHDAQALDMNIGRTNNTEYFDGAIDDLRLYNRPLSAAEAKALYESYDAKINLASGQKGLVGHFKFDGNTKDATPYSRVGTLYGDVTPAVDRKGRENGAYYFPGNSLTPRVEYTNYAMPTDEVTVSSWMKVTPGGYGLVMSYGVPGQYNEFLFLNEVLNGEPALRLFIQGTARNLTNFEMRDDQWHHFVATWRSSDGALRMYVDGAQVYSGSIYAGSPLESGGCLMFGQEQDSLCGGFQNGQSLTGSQDDVKIYNRVLSLTEIQKEYETYDAALNINSYDQDVSLSSGLIGYWKFNGNANDSTPYSRNGVVDGASLTADRLTRINSAYNFDGNSHIQVSNIKFTYPMTFNFWTKLHDNSDQAHFIYGSHQTGGDGYGGQNECHISHQTSTFRLYCQIPGRVVSNFSHGGYFDDLNWHMVTLALYEGRLRLYKDGVLQANEAMNGVPDFSSYLEFINFGKPNSNSRMLNGVMDDIRMYDRGLNAAEVAALYQSQN